MNVSIISAMIGGFLSFFSPCIIPLIPVYVLYLFSKDKDKFKNALFFVLGFSIVFIGFGILVSALGSAFSQSKWIIVKISAMIIVLMGLVMLDLSPDFLKNLFIPIGSRGNNETEKTPFVLGMVLSISWTPCIGPILTSILALAAAQNTFIKGVILLVFYSIGFSVPFLITAIFMESLRGIFAVLNKYIKLIEYITGIFMIIFGLIVFFDKLNLFR